MLNHMRTLLLNRKASSLATPTALVPARYVPVALTTILEAVRTLFIPAGLAPDIEQRYVDRVMPILHRPELEPYTLRFDSRITYDKTVPGRLIDLCSEEDVTAGINVGTVTAAVAGLVPEVASVSSLFTWPAYQADLDLLKQGWYTAPDGVTRTGCLLLAYLYQVERARNQ